MRIFMTGGTGFVETTHTTRLIELGHEVTVLTIALSKKPGVMGGVSLLEGGPTKEGVDTTIRGNKKGRA